YSWAQFLQSSSSLLLPLCFRDPHVLTISHDVGKNGTSDKDHVSSPWRIFDSDLEVLHANPLLSTFSSISGKPGSPSATYLKHSVISLCNLAKPKLLQLLLQSTRQTRIHTASTTQYNRLVQTCPCIDICIFHRLEKLFSHSSLIDIHQMRLE